MKKICLVILLLSAFAFSYSEVDGMEAIENVRKRMSDYDENYRGVEGRVFTELEADGLELMEKRRKAFNESLELKVFRSDKNPRARVEAYDDAFETGKDRMQFLRWEEQQMVEYDKALGKKTVDESKHWGKRYENVYKKYKGERVKISKLEEEIEALEERLTKLDQLETNITGTLPSY